MGEREEDDQYFTKPQWTDAIVTQLTADELLLDGQAFLEPSVGKGAFAVSLLENGDPFHAGCYGVAASAAAVRRYGSQPSYPRREDIEARLPDLRQGSRDRSNTSLAKAVCNS